MKKVVSSLADAPCARRVASPSTNVDLTCLSFHSALHYVEHVANNEELYALAKAAFNRHSPPETQPPPPLTWTLKQAVGVTKRHPDTLIAWANQYGVGWKVGGRWYFERLRLLELLSPINREK